MRSPNTIISIGQVALAMRLLIPSLVFICIFHMAATSQSLPAGYMHCSFEGGDCLFDGTKQVWFGADTRWIKMVATNGTTCDTATFGSDPAQGVEKQCHILQSRIRQSAY